MTELNVRAWGEGADAVLVHGSIAAGEENWEMQRPLADDGFRLVVPDRRAYGPHAPQGAGEDFLEDADDVAQLLGERAHLVGHSYGGLGAMLAAGRRPDAVRSLAVIEPPAFSVRPDHTAVAELQAQLEAVLARQELDDRAFLLQFLTTVGVPIEEVPDEMIGRWAGQVGPLRNGRPVWEVELPLDRLAAAPFPKIVFSGAHHPAFEAVCDELTERLGAERAIIEGAGHEVMLVGERFNTRLLEFWRSA